MSCSVFHHYYRLRLAWTASLLGGDPVVVVQRNGTWPPIDLATPMQAAKFRGDRIRQRYFPRGVPEVPRLSPAPERAREGNIASTNAYTALRHDVLSKPSGRSI
jgi:hypothetical protein